MSWIRTDEQRALFGEILEESARALAEEPPGSGRTPAVLRLASADAELIGLHTLGRSLRALSDRSASSNFPPADRTGYAGSLKSISGSLRRGQDVDRELNGLDERLGPAVQPAWEPASAASSLAVPPEWEPPPPVVVEPTAAPEPPAPGAGAELYEPRLYLEVPAAGSLPGSGPELGPGLHGRALVLDPGFVSRSQLVRVLRKLGWEAVEYDLTSHALEALEVSAADLFIADARRLKVTSKDLVAEVARRCPGRPAQVLFLVDVPNPNEEMRLRSEGAAGCIARPVDEGALRTLLDSILPSGGNA